MPSVPIVARVGFVDGVSAVCPGGRRRPGAAAAGLMTGVVIVSRRSRHVSLPPSPFAYIQSRTPTARRAPPVPSPAARAMSAVPKYLLCHTTPTYGANSRRTR